jgi:hypothetical protein
VPRREGDGHDCDEHGGALVKLNGLLGMCKPGGRRKRRVTMLVSYGEHLVAGRVYKLDAAEADALIHKGYADGELVEANPSDAVARELALVQTISI